MGSEGMLPVHGFHRFGVWNLVSRLYVINLVKCCFRGAGGFSRAMDLGMAGDGAAACFAVFVRWIVAVRSGYPVFQSVAGSVFLFGREVVALRAFVAGFYRPAQCSFCKVCVHRKPAFPLCAAAPGGGLLFSQVPGLRRERRYDRDGKGGKINLCVSFVPL